jgi:NAD(P)-dependent dehydrogenase (short-subunit alcohol dehydrogenase family)
MEDYAGSGKLAGKIALVTGGDSGIERAVAIGFAREGADVAIAYLDEHEDTSRYILSRGVPRTDQVVGTPARRVA